LVHNGVSKKFDFERIQKLDTCLVSNAIERLKGRPRNEGSIAPSALHSIFPSLPPVLGYAVTGRMRSTSAPVEGRAYHENMHWWRYVSTMPAPRIMVVQDVDERPGVGALVGELHAVIGLALKCVAYVSNGAVRDIEAVESLGFQLFAGAVAVTHMYAHISEYGHPVEIGGLEIHPGDLVHADRHGVHKIPLEVAAEIPRMAAQIREEEAELKKFCRSPRFSLDGLERQFERLPGDGVEARLGRER